MAVAQALPIRPVVVVQQMKRRTAFGLLGVVLLALLAPVAAVAPVGAATPELALSVSRDTVYAGQDFVAAGRSDVACDWILTWNGQRKTAQDARLVRAGFEAPPVTRKTRIRLHATCFAAGPGVQRPALPTPPAPRSGASQTVRAAVAPVRRASLVVTVLPLRDIVNPPGENPPGTNPGTLPNVGGPALWLLVAGALLTLAGAESVRRSRRRSLPPPLA